LRKLKKDSPPELQGHHKQSVVYLTIVGLPVVIVMIALKIEGFLMPAFLPIVCTFSLIFLGIWIWRAFSARCSECKGGIKKKGRLYVVEQHKVCGSYPSTPWNVFYCEGCKKEWRVPAIHLNEKTSLSEKDYQKLLNTGEI